MLDNCFIDEGYSGVFTQHMVLSPINLGGHEKIHPSQVCMKKLLCNDIFLCMLCKEPAMELHV